VVARLQLRQQEDAMTINLLGWAAAAVFALRISSGRQ
jgi:hypothetical protein